MTQLDNIDYNFITDMATEVCKAKISFIKLNETEKKFSPSLHGIKLKHIAKDLKLFKSPVNCMNKILIVEDITKDNRFLKNPILCNDLQIIFYAEIPLIQENGIVLGSLHVMDYESKKLTPQQVHLLEILAKQVIQLHTLKKQTEELKQQNKDLEKTAVLFNESQRINKIGAWELDIATGATFWTDEVYEIHEVANDLLFDKATGIEFYHPDDKPIILNAVENAISNEVPFDVQCRFITAKSNLRWVRASGKVITENGKKTKLIGTFQDITKIKESEQKFQGIFNSTFSFIGLLDTTGILIEANETALKTANLTPEDVIGKYFWDCYWWQISPATQEQLKKNFNEVLQGKEVTYEVLISVGDRLSLTILFSMRPVFDQYNNVIFIVPEGRPIQEMVDDRFRHKAVLEGTNVGTWEWNVQTGATVFNERWYEILGYNFEEITLTSANSWMNLMHPEDLIESNRRLNDCFEKKWNITILKLA